MTAPEVTLLPNSASLAEPPCTRSAVWVTPSAFPSDSYDVFRPRPIDATRIPVVVTRYVDVLPILLDDGETWQHSVAPQTVPREARRYVPDSSWMLEDVPGSPVLGLLRGMNTGYGPAAREFVRRLTALLLALLLDKPPAWNLSRVLDEVAFRLAIEHVLKAPPLLEHVPQIRELATRRRTDRLAGDGPHPYGYFGADSQRELAGVFLAIHERRSDLPPGIAKELILLCQKGRLGLREMASSLALLLFVHEQLAASASSLLALLLEHDLQDYARRGLRDPVLSPQLLEEGFRRGLSFPVSMMTPRRPVVLSGVAIPAGMPVLVSFAAANIDTERFGRDAGTFDPRRPRQAHIAFSMGAHRCKGASGSWQFVEDVLSVLLSILPDVRLARDGLILREVTGVAWTAPRLLVEPR